MHPEHTECKEEKEVLVIIIVIKWRKAITILIIFLHFIYILLSPLTNKLFNIYIVVYKELWLYNQINITAVISSMEGQSLTLKDNT